MSGHWQYRILSFGLHGAPETFQKLMDIILHPHYKYAAAHLDDVIIHSSTWDRHLLHLKSILLELRKAGLAANPQKCYVGLTKVQCLGYHIRQGLLKLQEKMIKAVQKYIWPTTQLQVRAFLGLAADSCLTFPLSDLTRKHEPDKVQCTI